MEYKSIEVSWIFETDLTNMNAGEGSTNLKEIKSYNNGLPYISGQSMRHALRSSIKREYKDEFKCTPEFPCGDIENCWTCDLFGYLLPSSGDKRWSPIKASPALGQIRYPITNDLIFRMVEDIKCPNCNKKFYPLEGRENKSVKIKKDETDLTCPHCGKKSKAPYDIRQAIAYKQLIKNIYKSNISIDLDNIGLEEVPKISNGKLAGVENIASIATEEKIKRIIAILNGIYNLSDFANQSREMVNASPDLVIIGLQKYYNHRLASTLKLDEDGNINTEQFNSVVNDALNLEGTKIYVGYIKGVIKNEKDFIDSLKNLNNHDEFILCEGPRKAFDSAIASLTGDSDGSS
ncbi:hypothetical protein [uncultured Methanobrevibacter sp.]|uniref:hypothetical protein n=1 Tax=uncultured Methanobrevibacter sp. TaxID=253161 RepID=UPI002628B845|nr:hypothetical protein [uncultured Methanobrevibacter sp.]